MSLYTKFCRHKRAVNQCSEDLFTPRPSKQGRLDYCNSVDSIIPALFVSDFGAVSPPSLGLEDTKKGIQYPIILASSDTNIDTSV